MPEIPVPASTPSIVPETEYDRWGIADLSIVTNLTTGAIRIGGNARKANAQGFSPYTNIGPDGLRHSVNIQIQDLIARFANDPEALGAIQVIMPGILLLVQKELQRLNIL